MSSTCIKKGQIISSHEQNLFLINPCVDSYVSTDEIINSPFQIDHCDVCAGVIYNNIISNSKNKELHDDDTNNRWNGDNARNGKVELDFKQMLFDFYNDINNSHNEKGNEELESVANSSFTSSRSKYKYCSLKCKEYAKTHFLGEYVLDNTSTAEMKNLGQLLKKIILKPYHRMRKNSSTTNRKEEMDLIDCSLLITCSICCNIILSQEKTSQILIHFIKSCLDDIMTNNSNKMMQSNYNNCDDDVHDKVIECWTTLRNAFPPPPTDAQQYFTKCENHNKNNQKEKKTITYVIHQLLSSPSLFSKVQSTIVRNCLYEITVHHLMYDYIQKQLLTLDESDLFKVMKVFDTISKKYNQQEAVEDQNAKNLTINNIHMKESNVLQKHERRNNDDDNNLQSQQLHLWRKATRLVQLTSTINQMNDENELISIMDDQNLVSYISNNLHKKYIVFNPSLKLEHSCIPNCIVEGTHDNDDVFKQIKLSIVALNDVQNNCCIQLKISRIHNIDDNIDDRAKSFRELFGSNFICKCVRCECERNWSSRGQFIIKRNDDEGKKVISNSNAHNDDENEHIFASMELKQLGDLAMQQGRYTDATDYYDLCLKHSSSDVDRGDVLHAKCASYLERGMFLKAQMMWNDAYTICPNHAGIKLQVVKQNAYKVAEEVNNINSFQKESFTTILPEECFVTNDNFPIISPNECKEVIAWAEEAAKTRKEGWTTSRHYAVSTTDIPIHEVPMILDWFNRILAQKLCPLLAVQFGEDNVGKNGSSIHIHDAFVVRYDANDGQRHLPLHRDQSTHSFTIALNDTSEYDGGGTFIAKINRAVRPSVGGALSFRGDSLLHGGDPLIRGRRYIIVAFCYASKKQIKPSKVLQAKRRKFDSKIFDKERKDKNVNEGSSSSPFTFGFELS